MSEQGATDPEKFGYGKELVSAVSYHAAYNCSHHDVCHEDVVFI